MEGAVQAKACREPLESGNSEEVPEASSKKGAMPTPGF